VAFSSASNPKSDVSRRRSPYSRRAHGCSDAAEADHLFRILGVSALRARTVILITHKLREIMAITIRFPSAPRRNGGDPEDLRNDGR